MVWSELTALMGSSWISNHDGMTKPSAVGKKKLYQLTLIEAIVNKGVKEEEGVEAHCCRRRGRGGRRGTTTWRAGTPGQRRGCGWARWLGQNRRGRAATVRSSGCVPPCGRRG